MQLEQQAIQSLCQSYSIETTPRGFEKLAPLVNYLPKGTTVYITHLTGSTFADTVRTAEAVVAQGYRAVAHIAARNLASPQELETGLLRLNKAGIGDVLLLAGGAGSARHYRDSLAILESGILEGYELHSIGFAGHPEGLSVASQYEVDKALQMKQSYAIAHPRKYYLMTQFCFIAEPVLVWCRALKAQGIEFPVHIGIPGVASTVSLIKHAKACGVGASLNFLLQNSGGLRLIMGTSEPSKLIADLARAQLQENAIFDYRLHFFPLGDFKKTADWVNAVAMGKFTLDAKRGICLEK